VTDFGIAVEPPISCQIEEVIGYGLRDDVGHRRIPNRFAAAPQPYLGLRIGGKAEAGAHAGIICINTATHKVTMPYRPAPLKLPPLTEDSFRASWPKKPTWKK